MRFLRGCWGSSMSCATSWILALCIVLGTQIACCAQELSPKASSSTRVHSFDDDHGFESATTPSDAVLDALLARAEVQEGLEDVEDQGRESFRSYFKAVTTDAGSSVDKVWVVTGTRIPMAAGDSDWFWIVRTSNKETRVILFTIGHTLTLEKRRTNGYRDVLAMTGTPAQPEELRFRYDGAMYRLFRDRLKEVRR